MDNILICKNEISITINHIIRFIMILGQIISSYFQWKKIFKIKSTDGINNWYISGSFVSISSELCIILLNQHDIYKCIFSLSFVENILLYDSLLFIFVCFITIFITFSLYTYYNKKTMIKNITLCLLYSSISIYFCILFILMNIYNSYDYIKKIFSFIILIFTFLQYSSQIKTILLNKNMKSFSLSMLFIQIIGSLLSFFCIFTSYNSSWYSYSMYLLVLIFQIIILILIVYYFIIEKIEKIIYITYYN